MATPFDEAIELLKKDPVRGYVTIAVLAARAPNPAILVKLKGRDLVLPDWGESEWRWYAGIALTVGARADGNATVNQRKVDLQSHRRLATLVKGRLAVLNGKPTPQQASELYHDAVRLVISSAAIVEAKSRGEIFDESLREASKEIPLTIGTFLAGLLKGPAKDILLPAAKAAAQILAEIFEEVAKSGIGIAIMVIAGLYLWSKSRNSRSE